MQACHWKAHTLFYLKDFNWSDNNNIYLGPVVVTQVLDPSPQHSHLWEEKGGGGTPSAAKSSGVYPRVQVLVTSPEFYGKVSYILNCIMYSVFISVPSSHI